MLKAEKDEWVNALTSGQFRQGYRYLNRNGVQCCLGVKCILDVRADRHGVIKRDGDFTAIQYAVEYEGVFTESMPTRELLDRWGLTYEQANFLARMNDSGVTFLKIAEWIQENVQVTD